MKEKEEKKMEITIVREENQSYFEPLMPRELWEKSDLVLGAIEEGAACGVLAATEESEHIMALEYLFVAEDYRRKGIATALLDGLHEIGRYSGMDLTICQYALNEEQSDLDLCLDKNLFELEEVRTPVYRTAFRDLSPQYFGRKRCEKISFAAVGGDSQNVEPFCGKAGEVSGGRGEADRTGGQIHI